VSSNASRIRQRTPSGSGRPQLRVVRRKSRKLIVRRGSRRAAPYAIGGAILVLGIIFTVLLEQVVLAQSAFKLAELREELVAAENQSFELQLEVARLESSDRIERFAREELGMIDSDLASADYIYADVSRDSTVPKTQRLQDGAGEQPPSTESLAGEELAP
jgi:cell division protein FtsL